MRCFHLCHAKLWRLDHASRVQFEPVRWHFLLLKQCYVTSLLSSSTASDGWHTDGTKPILRGTYFTRLVPSPDYFSLTPSRASVGIGTETELISHGTYFTELISRGTYLRGFFRL
jgi:hypothetical protein